MVYVRAHNIIRTPKDILLLALRNLWTGEELICTTHSYDAMRGRIKEIIDSFADREFRIIREGTIWKIWRTV
jgi:hypothetical protein